jgi:lipid-binding SYLF domain-containing protein
MRHSFLTVRLLAAAAATVVAMAFTDAYAGDEGKGSKTATLTKEAEITLQRCKDMSPACADATSSAAGVLVFPEVTSASIIVGGAGAKGVLWVNGKIDGYYSLGEASIGPQVGVQKSSEVFALNGKALAALKDEGSWKIGTEADVTVVGAGATDQTASGQGGTAVFVFDEKGLSAGVAVEGVTINRLDPNKV